VSAASHSWYTLQPVFTKLEQGAKSHPKSQPWSGPVKHQRRTDALLQYIHQARNSDEHGIQRITDRKIGVQVRGAPGAGEYGLASMTTGSLTITR
jgi:hypothetical protein